MASPIASTKAYKYKDDVYNTIEEARQAAIQELFKGNGGDTLSPETAADVVVDNATLLIEILAGSTRPRKKRSDAGKAHAKPAKPVGIAARLADKLASATEELSGVKVDASSKYKNK